MIAFDWRMLPFIVVLERMSQSQWTMVRDDSIVYLHANKTPHVILLEQYSIQVAPFAPLTNTKMETDIVEGFP